MSLKRVQLCHTCSASTCRPYWGSWNGQECSAEGAAAACVPDGQEKPQTSAGGHPAEDRGLLSGTVALRVSMQHTVTLDAGMHASSLPCSVQADCLDKSLNSCATLLTLAGPWRCGLCHAAMLLACALAATGLIPAQPACDRESWEAGQMRCHCSMAIMGICLW